MQNRLATILITLAFLSGVTHAQDDLAGDWMLELQPDGPAMTGLLQLEKRDGEWHAWVEGGPAPVTVNGNEIDIAIDSRDLRGFVFFYQLTGRIEDNELSGRYTIESKAKVRVSDGTWHAGRHTPEVRGGEPRPFDMGGTWAPARGVDIRKYSMDLTPAAAEWHADYLMHYDQPNVRCVSPGIVAMVAWGAYPFEVLASDQRLTFLYEFDSEVRRIFLDGREPPPYYQPSGMGFSTGRWEGNALVVDTRLLSKNIRDFRGEPISENARLEEVYTLSEDGNSLHAVVTLHDPENYRRPPIRRRAWTRNPDLHFYPNECDPDSFYRQMYNEGLLDMYFERSRRRF